MGRQFKPGQLQTGSLYNISSSYALTASFALNGGGTTINTGSFVTTSSFNAFTASYATGSFTGSFIGDGSQLTGIVSSKWTGSNPISRQSDVEITGSLRVQGSITGSLFGTASWASNAVTASYVQTAQTASYVLQAVSSSFSSTASIALQVSTSISTQNLQHNVLFVDTSGPGNIQVDGGLRYNPNQDLLTTTSSYTLLANTASYVQTAQTASYVLQAVSASFATSASYAPDTTFPFTGSARITGSLGVTGSTSILAYTASTATIFNVRNSADTLDIIKANGRGDVFIGQGAGRLTTGLNNTFMGLNAGSNNITGQANTAIGSGALQFAGSGTNNTAIGFYALNNAAQGTFTGDLNIGIGYYAGAYIISGQNNIAIGNNAGGTLTTGNRNTIIGAAGLASNSTNNNVVISDGASNNALWKDANHFVGIGHNPTSGTLGAKLDVKAQGALSTDTVFRVRNSVDTQNLMSITGDGRVAIGLNAQILGTTDAFKNVVIGGAAKDISAAGVTENAVALGYNAVSNNGGTAIGANTSITAVSGVALGANAIAGTNSTAIGASAQADGTSGYQSLAIGYGARASALLSGIIAVGQSSYTNALGQTLAFCVDPSGANSQTILLTNKANLVFRNSTQLTSGTHWDTTATNTITIHSGSIPTTTISGSVQFYAATGSLTNNTRPHFRTGNGTIVWLGDESRLFNVTASNMMVGVTSSLALFTSQRTTVNAGTTTIYAFPTASYDGAFIDYTARSGSNARAGQIMGIWSGSAVNFTETTTTDFGSTTGLTFGMSISASSMIVSASAATAGWTVKTIIRSI